MKFVTASVVVLFVLWQQAAGKLSPNIVSRYKYTALVGMLLL